MGAKSSATVGSCATKSSRAATFTQRPMFRG
jgi:hypothetical protein